MLELERAFGSAEQSYPSFPLFIVRRHLSIVSRSGRGRAYTRRCGLPDYRRQGCGKVAPASSKEGGRVRCHRRDDKDGVRQSGSSPSGIVPALGFGAR